ncbi:MAG: phosphatidate cytidylyltransferase [Deltaproteobacteria bacterium]|nr:phosphatidate cytidylyltransferase [Deltaproteobacteria bacterium]
MTDTPHTPHTPETLPQSRLVEAIESQPGADYPIGRAQLPDAAKKKSDLKARVATAIVLVPVIILGIIKGGAIWTAIVAVVAAAATWEFFNFMDAKGLRGSKGTGMVGSLALVFGASFSNEYFSTLILTVIMLTGFTRQLRKREISAAITGSAVTVFGVIYVGWLTSHLVWLRNIGSELQVKYFANAAGAAHAAPGFADIGMYFLFMGVAATFLADTGGYFFGRAFGRHKLAPSISPKKTWEGFVGQIVGAIAGATAARFVFTTWIFGDAPYSADFPYTHCVILGVLVAVLGLIGDLYESMLKRDAQVKDASGLLPGHGGFLDRLDSINFAIPMTYYYVKLYYYWVFSPRTESDLRDLADYLARYVSGN